MPRRDDDSGEFEPSCPKRKTFPAWVIALLVVASLVMLCGVGGVIGLWVLGSTARQAADADVAAPVRPDAGPKTWTRDAFRKEVKGRSADEIIEAVGKPDATYEKDGQSAQWVYRRRTVDPISEKVDEEAVVVFRNHVGHETTYTPSR